MTIDFSNREAEEAVLGSILLDPDVFFEVADIIQSPNSFQSIDNRHVWQAMQAITQLGEPIDTVTVMSELRRCKSHVEDYYIVGLVTAVPTALNAASYARQVAESDASQKIYRGLNRGVNALINNEAGDTPYELAAKMATYFSDLARGDVRQAETSLTDEIDELLTDIYDRVEDHDKNVPYRRLVPTGLTVLDDKLDGGYERGSYNLIAGVPGMGKTALLGQMVRNMLLDGRRVQFFSLEMTARDFHRRNLSSLIGVPTKRLKRGSLTDAEMHRVAQGAQQLTNLRLDVEDHPAVTPTQIRHAVQRLIIQSKAPDIVFIDYLQLIRAEGRDQDEYTAVTQASHALREMAKEFDIPFVVAAQLLHKDISKRQNTRPRQGDIFGSSQPEKDAHTEIFMYRPWVYDPLYNPDLTELIIAKNRDGETGTVEIKFNPLTSGFTSVTASPQTGQTYVSPTLAHASNGVLTP